MTMIFKINMILINNKISKKMIFNRIILAIFKISKLVINIPNMTFKILNCFKILIFNNKKKYKIIMIYNTNNCLLAWKVNNFLFNIVTYKGGTLWENIDLF